MNGCIYAQECRYNMQSKKPMAGLCSTSDIANSDCQVLVFYLCQPIKTASGKSPPKVLFECSRPALTQQSLAADQTLYCI